MIRMKSTTGTSAIKKLKDNSYDVVIFNAEETRLQSLEQTIEEIHRVAKATCIVFCNNKNLSKVYEFFLEKDKLTRIVVLKKRAISTIFAKGSYAEDVSFAVICKKDGAYFRNVCRTSVYEYEHNADMDTPYDKPSYILEEIIADNSRKGDKILDVVGLSGQCAIACKNIERDYTGYFRGTSYEIAKANIEKTNVDSTLLKTLDRFADDDVLYIGSGDGFFFIGTKQEVIENIDNVGLKMLEKRKEVIEKRKRYIKKAPSIIAKYDKCIVDSESKEKIEKYKELKNKVKERVRMYFYENRRSEDLNCEYESPLNREVVWVFKKNLKEEPGYSIKIKGYDLGGFWFKHEFDDWVKGGMK